LKIKFQLNFNVPFKKRGSLGRLRDLKKDRKSGLTAPIKWLFFGAEKESG